ncbi:hypothetical protein H0H87_003732, partial [Tephrocybe sp. NHM501043]
MASEIQQLSDMISSSVSALLAACHENNTPFPNPNQPFTPESEAFRANKVALDATNIIAAAALQLADIVLDPHVSIMNLVAGHFKNAALHTALELNVTEILREAGPQGLHANEIAKTCDVDGNKLSRVLRMLSLNHCYKEVSPDVFANTRISSVLDSGKSVAELLERICDGARYSSYLCDNIKDSKTGGSNEPIHSAFNRAEGVDLPLFQWYEEKEQSYRRHRFALAMSGLAHMQPEEILDDVVNWSALPAGSVVVDVGAGIGVSAVSIARKNEHLTVIAQDLAKHWRNLYPEVLETGKVTFVEHDFFDTQPVSNASVFILKQVLHDWADPYCAKILKALRAVATPETKLVIVDNIVAYACHDPTIDSGLNPSYKEAPAPLLPNFGAANVMPYVLDLA